MKNKRAEGESTVPMIIVILVVLLLAVLLANKAGAFGNKGFDILGFGTKPEPNKEICGDYHKISSTGDFRNIVYLVSAGVCGGSEPFNLDIKSPVSNTLNFCGKQTMNYQDEKGVSHDIEYIFGSMYWFNSGDGCNYDPYFDRHTCTGISSDNDLVLVAPLSKLTITAGDALLTGGRAITSFGLNKGTWGLKRVDEDTILCFISEPTSTSSESTPSPSPLPTTPTSGG